MKKLIRGIKSFFAKKSTAQNNDASKPTAQSEFSENKPIYSEPMRKIIDVEETPFHIIEEDWGEEKPKTYKIVIGNVIASEKTFKNQNEAEKYIYSKPWKLMYATIGILTQKFIEAKKA